MFRTESGIKWAQIVESAGILRKPVVQVRAGAGVTPVLAVRRRTNSSTRSLAARLDAGSMTYLNSDFPAPG